MKCECGFQSTKVKTFPFWCRCGRHYTTEASEPVTPANAQHLGRPGTELKKLLASMGISVGDCRACDERVIQMDRWGVEGCREHFDEIRGWLVESQAKTSWQTKAEAVGRSALTGLALQLDPLDIPGSLVMLAIDLASRSRTTLQAKP